MTDLHRQQPLRRAIVAAAMDLAPWRQTEAAKALRLYLGIAVASIAAYLVLIAAYSVVAAPQ